MGHIEKVKRNEALLFLSIWTIVLRAIARYVC